MNSNSDSIIPYSFRTLVINVTSRLDRRYEIIKRLNSKMIPFEFIPAFEAGNLEPNRISYVSDIAECIWNSHRKCLLSSSELNDLILVIEDDAILHLDFDKLSEFAQLVHKNDIDFLQIGFLYLNPIEIISIRLRNIYNFFTKYNLVPSLFKFLGFHEVARIQNQSWRHHLPNSFVVNDIRYGAHCYFISPKLAYSISKLNSPPFLAVDDLYVALSRMKSFRMARLSKSLSSQDGSISSFSQRYLLDN